MTQPTQDKEKSNRTEQLKQLHQDAFISKRLCQSRSAQHSEASRFFASTVVNYCYAEHHSARLHLAY